EIREKLETISKLEEWISKIFISLVSFTERNVMMKLKSEFSSKFADWFSMLVSDIFEVSLDDEFTPVINYQDYELDYSYLSGGERTAIALAYRLSLNQVVNSLLSKIKTKDIVILDEPTDGFSEQQLDKMRDVLRQLEVKQLIIVSHEPKIEGFVENVIRFKKEQGVSRMFEEKLI
ncbi:MAG: SMC family ATPase, partial [Nanoarchaeota archaeon]